MGCFNMVPLTPRFFVENLRVYGPAIHCGLWGRNIKRWAPIYCGARDRFHLQPTSMRCFEVTDACSRADRRAVPLVGSLRRLGCTIFRTVIRGSTRKGATCPPPPPFSPSEGSSPPSPNDDLPCQHHSELARRLYPSLSPICHWFGEDDIRIVWELPVSAGGFTDLWKGSLENRQVAIKSYRRYLTADSSQISVVSWSSPILRGSYR
jgi:hypothetical protein